jgi:hypothetical protein
MTMVADWYRKNVGTKYELSTLPWLYQKYAGHDNNREFQIADLSETQNQYRMLYHEWFPVAHYCQHQSAPFPTRIQISPAGEPANPNVHPLVRWWEDIIGPVAAKGLEEQGLPGSILGTFLDFYYAGSVSSSAEEHNIAALLTETATGAGYATPRSDRPADFDRLAGMPGVYKDLIPGQYYPSPWKGGAWHFDDQVKYNLVVSKTLLELVANNRSNLLFDAWKMATDNIERFKSEPPYGWIISAAQRDPNTTALMLDRFLLESLEIYQADAAFTHEGISYPKGCYIIPTRQPYGLWAKSLLERQEFPDLRKYPYLWQAKSRPDRFFDDAKGEEMLPPLVPFENAGWTMPLLMGIDSRLMSKPLNVAMHQVDKVAPPAASLTGTGPQVVFSHTDNNCFKAVNRIQKAGGKVSVSLAEFTLSGAKYPVGTFIVDAASVPAATLKEIAGGTQVPMAAGQVSVRANLLAKPRIGIYLSWVANMDGGWMSFLFDQYEFPYTELRDGDMRAGNLRERFDVIILPDQSPDSIVKGHAKGMMPDDYVGGMTQEGVEHLIDFVQGGGTLICNKASFDLAVGLFHLPVKNVLRGLPQKEFLVPGSILRVDYDAGNPLAYGMEEKGFGYVSDAHAFDLLPEKPAGDRKMTEPALRVVARFPDEPLLSSGFLVGEKYLQGKAVVLEASVGQGRVVLFGLNVVNRAQSNATHKLLYNAIFCIGGQLGNLLEN